ncbi:4-coumarate--CoA ligase-like 5 [Neodiprion virginianus]|uniref:4-coumarate--CoA ligase-like 5 n=1 Tax=Neodiprion virginianus TaxID=2961670 RepID=UPI001EE74B69|nr:4-coumarate--CoA ligase-like 5 [Neodiprion virginianus]
MILQIDGATGEEYTFEKMQDRSVRCALWLKKQGLLPKFSKDAKLLKSDALSKYDLSCIKSVICGGAKLSVASRDAFAKKLPGASILAGYGMTELGAGTSVQSNSSKPGSRGRLLINCQLRVVDTDTGRVLGTNQVGELL